MADNEKTAPEYTMGYDEVFQTLLNRRSAATHAAYLLPNLKLGMRVLDFGCGPGTISMGLAEAVKPGELHGIDMEASQVDMARAAAVAGGHENAVFHVGDVTNLPFEDDFFDAANCHAVLMHEPDTQAALAEVKRVLKPGGIIGCGESIVSSSYIKPDLGILDGVWSLFANHILLNGGHPEMGTELRTVMHEAGFADITATASFECFGTPSDVDFFHAFNQGRFFSPSMMETRISNGLATQQQFDRWRSAHDEWKDHPGAVVGLAWGEAIGRKP